MSGAFVCDVCKLPILFGGKIQIVIVLLQDRRNVLALLRRVERPRGNVINLDRFVV